MRFSLIIVLSITLTGTACVEGDVDGDSELVLDLGFQNLPPLGDSYIYEGWLITPAGALSTGRFSGEDVLSFPVDPEVVEQASKFVLTIEPTIGDDPVPSNVHILAGDISADGHASLSTDNPAAIGTNFSDARGDFILATPTTSTNSEDGAQGIWWLVPGEPALPALALPTLPAGWVYEGWVVGTDGPVSTGRFSNSSGADSDGAGATAGPDGSPPFPGQDFIDPARDLVGMTAVITVEPDPDNSPEPFGLKPLVTTTISSAEAPTVQAMLNQSGASIPWGIATLR